jgi:hypothetical protein
LVDHSNGFAKALMAKASASKPKAKAKGKPAAKPSKALVVKGKTPSTAAPSRARARATIADRARKKRIFLIVLEKTCNISHAARAAQIDRGTAYDWRQVDDAFNQAWIDAEEAAVDKLEQVAFERAIKGESDRMLEILLKSHRPHKYVEKQQVLHAHAMTEKTAETLSQVGMSLEQAVQLYKEKLG